MWLYVTVCDYIVYDEYFHIGGQKVKMSSKEQNVNLLIHRLTFESWDSRWQL